MARSHIVVVEGAGDIGSGVAHALHRAGFSVVLIEGPAPLTTRRRMAFSDAVFDGVCELEGFVARRVTSVSQLELAFSAGEIPLCVDAIPAGLEFAALIDARMRKRVTPTDRRQDAGLFIGLGPGFSAGENCHFAIETQHGEQLGRVIRSGPTSTYDGIPGEVAGTRRERQVHATCDGVFLSECVIGSEVSVGDLIGVVDATEHHAGIAGIVKGLLRPGVAVVKGTRLAEVIPRLDGLAIAGVGERPRRLGAGVCLALRSL